MSTPKYEKALQAGRQPAQQAKPAAPSPLAALQEIGKRGPVPGYGTAGALLLRLTLTQSIAREAIPAAEALEAKAAALPALLEALQAVCEWEAAAGGYEAPCFAQARAALAHAKGAA